MLTPRSAAPLFAGWRATAPAAWHDSYTPLFAALLAGTALIVGGLSYLPALAMGPIVEQLLLGR